MAAAAQAAILPPPEDGSMPEFFTIEELAARWKCSRGSVYNWLRGWPVVHFAPRGRKGCTRVSRDVVLALEKKQTRTLR